MWTLRIYLMGLVALVPVDRDGRAELVILLQKHASAAMEHQHHAVLVCDPGTEGCKPGEGGDIQEALKLDYMPHGFFLDGVEIEIEQGGIGEVEYAFEGHRPWFFHKLMGVVPGKWRAARDAWWIPRMRDILPEAAAVKPGYIEEEADGIPPEKISARMRVREGRVWVYSLADVDQKVRSMTFKTIGSGMTMYGVKQAVADIVAVDIPIREGGRVVIYATPFGGERGQRLFKLKPRQTQEYVEILLGNLTPLRGGVKAEPASHFALYADLSKNQVGRVPVPHLGRRKCPQREVEESDFELPEVIRSVSAPPAPIEERSSEERRDKSAYLHCDVYEFGVRCRDGPSDSTSGT